MMNQVKENGLVAETTMRTQRSRRFPKHEKSLIFGILATGDQMKTFWKHEILEMAESDVCFVKSGHNHDAAIENCLRSLIVELEAFFCPKNGLQNAPKKPVVNALFGNPLQPNGDCAVIETNLELTF